MRIKNSSYNVFFNILQLMVTTILLFVTRTFFIRYLGKEMLGLDGLFSNILSMLSLTELGIGTAISFSLYKPLAEKDSDKISSLMTLYKKVYRAIALIVLIIGLLLLPFLTFVSNGYSGDNLHIYYLMYLFNTAASYILVYKEILIIADQREYKLFWSRLIFLVLMYTSQIIILIKTQNFIYYLVAMIVTNFLRNLINNIYITKVYSNIDFSTDKRIDKTTSKEITQNAKNMFVSRIGDYLLNGTDNIIISAINIGLTGIYSNYLAIVGVMKTLISAIYNGVTASFGNVIAIEKKDIQENIFNISTFICFLISGFITIELIFLLNPFIMIWAGSDYVVSFKLSIIIALNFYFYSNHVSLNSFKIASGQYKADRLIPLIQAIVNLAVSIVLGYYIGLAGVVLGTLVSYITVGFVFRPILLIKNIFKKSAFEYFYNQIKYGITLFIIFVINYVLFRYFNFDSSIIMLIVKSFIILVIYTIIVITLFNRDSSFKYVIDLLKKKIHKKTI